MEQFRRIQQGGVFLLCTGLGAAALVLFLQPLAPVHFLEAAFSLKSAGNSAASAVIPAFWAALCAAMLGASGACFGHAKNRARTEHVKCGDHNEDNWMFI